ncbi:MAG: AfsR/SARP family transcriptional regulator, partial [Gemmatimonadota bacterium]
MPFQLSVLGPAEVFLPDGKRVSLPLGKPLAVLVYAALSPQPPSRDEVASVFWPDAPREKALHSLRQALWVLKTAL